MFQEASITWSTRKKQLHRPPCGELPPVLPADATEVLPSDRRLAEYGRAATQLQVERGHRRRDVWGTWEGRCLGRSREWKCTVVWGVNGAAYIPYIYGIERKTLPNSVVLRHPSVNPRSRVSRYDRAGDLEEFPHDFWAWAAESVPGPSKVSNSLLDKVS